ncbi:hypothetical protein WME97_29470 [Sorangium sp. So ce367]|uniref:hypothetical protein n=1 Tax=Sorangium sp. So ce367 TaxID=3133305 RepID=UPI003F5F7D4B
MADHSVISILYVRRSLAACLPLLALIACGGDGANSPPTPETSGSGGMGTTSTAESVGATSSSGSGDLPASGTGGGGTSAGGGGDSATGATSGTGGGGNSTACTRELLKSTIDAYFEALAAHDPSTLPLADNVKFTENGEVLALGQDGLWKTAGALKYAHSALDTETCSSASQAVVPDGSMDIPLALRLKLQGREITEIETIAVRPGDYKVSGQNFASNTGAIIASGDTVAWEEPVPEDERNSRDELEGWMEKYFWMFPGGVCNTVSNCKRIENGGGSFTCSAGASCNPGQPGSGSPALPPRLIFADVERGIGVGFTMFMGNTDMHMFKMRDGQVYGVSAILGAASSSGWE